MQVDQWLLEMLTEAISDAPSDDVLFAAQLFGICKMYAAKLAALGA
ncbi:MAG: hypothetical protein II948_03855 [Synergistaceae bacterium]|nr:hypothetical protein [Synergistaceae bacterium]MBQ6909483.1 hypothetical protein [Synergistaceae bacterium]MBR0221363.1 hypothetical protein [Synergistaceae bacterium]